jgi:CBS domain-containing protein
MEHIKLSQLLEISSYDNLFQIVVLNAQDTLQEALRKFSGHKILSAPVRIERNHTTTYRMFDVMDAVLAMIQQDCDSSVLRKSIENFCNLSRTNAFIPIDENSTVKEAISRLSLSGVHRLVVMSHPEEIPTHLVSQMDILKWIRFHFGLIPLRIRDTEIQQIASKEIASVEYGEPIVEAMKKCSSHRYSGVAVLKEGKLLGNLSISDLKCLNEENCKGLLSLTVEEFLQQTKKYFKQPIVCYPDTRLEEAIELLTNEHVHRLYLVKKPENDIAIGVVSLSDIIHLLAQPPPKET